MIKIKKILLLGFFLVYSIQLVSASNNMLAVVNDDYVIFQYDLEKEIAFQKIINENLDVKGNDFEKLIINQMIEQYLMLQDSKQFNIRSSNSEVASILENIEQSKELEKGSLLQQAIDSGFTEQEFLSLMRSQVTADKVRQYMSFSQVKVSEQEIELELDRLLRLAGKAELLLYEISVFFDENTREVAKEKIDEVYRQLQQGADFKTIANQFSEALSSMNGGRMGWIPDLFLSNNILVQVRNLEINQPSEPFRDSNSYKILMIDNVRPLLQVDRRNPQQISQLRQYAQQKIFGEKAQIYLEEYNNSIYQNASIKIYETNFS